MSALKVQFSDLLKKGSNNICTQFGPKNTLKVRSTATSYSKSSFFIEVKGLSPSVWTGPYIELVVPMQFRFAQRTGAAAWAMVALNGYLDLNKTVSGATSNVPAAAPGFRVVDSVCKRPNGLCRAIRSCTLGINGASFSTQCDQWIDGIERLYSDGRVENCTGWSGNQPPFSNIGHPDHPRREPGKYKRCVEQIGWEQVKSSRYNGNVLDDLVYEIKFRTRLFLGPWLYSQFPGLGEAFGSNYSGAMPYVNSLTIECQLADNPLIHLFSQAADCTYDKFAFATGWSGTRTGAPADAYPAAITDTGGEQTIDFQRMWAMSKVGDITSAADAAAGYQTGILQPYVECQFLEPPSEFVNMQSVYSFSSQRFVTYEEQAQIAAITANDPVGAEFAEFSFQHIKIDKLASLYMIYVCDALNDVGTALGGRVARYVGGAGQHGQRGHFGASYSNMFGSIDWGSVVVSLSTKSNILGNLSSKKLGLTEKDQYRKFLKYSQRKVPMSFLEWRRSSQMILFSMSDVFLAFGGTFQQATLNIRFKARRTERDIGLTTRDMFVADNAVAPYAGGISGESKKGRAIPRNMVARLVMVEPTTIKISQTGCATEDVVLSEAEAAQAYRAQMGSGSAEVQDSSGVSQIAQLTQ